jgi:butyrate kinase
MKNEIILTVDPGSTSTKTALFHGKKELIRINLSHSPEELLFPIRRQLPMRLKAVRFFLQKSGLNTGEISLISARGGILPPLEAGAYRIDRAMVDYLSREDIGQHASNLAAPIAFLLAEETRTPPPAIIYDGVTTDQLDKLSHYSGSILLPRKSLCHCLNMREVARRTAQEAGQSYDELNFIVVHMGGGITLSLHSGGRLIDIISDDEGPMSPERSGRVPCLSLIKSCYSGKYSQQQMERMIRGEGGLFSYLGTRNVEEVLEEITQGNGRAEEVMQAMILQIAKGVGELSVVTKGKIDRIILTGEIARADYITNRIIERVKFIAPVTALPGDYEMEALAAGGLRVLRGEEPMKSLSFPELVR